MTETLKSALSEHADAVRFDAVDLDTLHRRGDRTLQRRRVALGAGGLVAGAAVVVATALAVLPGSDTASDRAPIARDQTTSVGSTATISWVEGSTLHRAGSTDLDLGRAAVAYVRTSVGYVFADVEGDIFSATGGEPTQVGSTDPEAIRLVSDPDGPVAAWLDAERSGIVTYDQSSGADLTLEDRVVGRDPELTALDGQTAYLDTGGFARSIDLIDGTVAAVDGAMGPVLDASGALVAIDTNGQGVVLAGSGQTQPLPQAFGSSGTFSPNGAWFSGDDDDPSVFNTSTLERLSFDAPRFFATGYEWLDDETLAMISSQSKSAPAELLTCTVPEGLCETTVELDTFEEMARRGFTFPLGVPIDY